MYKNVYNLFKMKYSLWYLMNKINLSKFPFVIFLYSPTENSYFKEVYENSDWA